MLLSTIFDFRQQHESMGKNEFDTERVCFLTVRICLPTERICLLACFKKGKEVVLEVEVESPWFSSVRNLKPRSKDEPSGGKRERMRIFKSQRMERRMEKSHEQSTE